MKTRTTASWEGMAAWNGEVTTTGMSIFGLSYSATSSPDHKISKSGSASVKCVKNNKL